jgi:KDO2-lipid IV(A) lauroyltransferase
VLAYLALWLWIRVLGRLPLRVLYALADAAGTLAWYGSPRLRSVTLDHMRHVYGGAASRTRLARSARGNVRSAARYWADMARAPHLAPGELIDRLEAVEGVDRFFEVYDRGCGVLFVSAHIGNPETLIRAVGTLGIEVLVLTEPLSPPRLHELVHEVRQAPGVRFVPADRQGVRLALEQLRAGKVVGVLADRDVLGTASPRPFFGERARLPSGAVDLALRTKSPIVTGVARRGRGRRMRVVLDPPIELERSGDRAADIEAGMQQVVGALEAGIRASPEQWFALHPVWGGLTS